MSDEVVRTRSTTDTANTATTKNKKFKIESIKLNKSFKYRTSSVYCMWITKLKLRHNDCPIVRRCEKFHVIIYSYPGAHYTKQGKVYATTTCYFQEADEQVKKRFLKDLKSDTRITNLEVSGDIFTYEINLGTKGEHVMLYHTQQLFFAKPVINHYDGHE